MTINSLLIKYIQCWFIQGNPQLLQLSKDDMMPGIEFLMEDRPLYRG